MSLLANRRHNVTRRGAKMTLAGREVLLVGESFHNAHALATRLQRWQFQCHFARNARAATDWLELHQVDLVLSDTHLSDGTGFRLLMTLADLPVTAFLCVPVENTCFWLPAINDGKACLGLPALRASEFVSTLEQMAHGLAHAPEVIKQVH
jgi:CheY-like chemotaxis protein